MDLFGKTVPSTPAHCDKVHLRILGSRCPQIPDLQAEMLGRGPDSAPALLKSAQRLETVGAALLLMACNGEYLRQQVLPTASRTRAD